MSPKCLRITKKFSFITLLLFLYSLSFAQTSKQVKRYEIDAKRIDIGYTSKDALPRGREFKRLDSTYYVGWMFEGGYKFEHAADFLGYKAASFELQLALDLLERDFKKEISKRTSDVMEYLQILKFHRDWDFTAYALMNCYSNMDDPKAVWEVLLRCKKMNLQDEQYLETFNSMAWTIHRNRFYDVSKAPFLKSTIDENEEYANKLLDSNLTKIKNDATLNSKLFAGNYDEEKNSGVWHYKSILNTYQFNIEKGAYYYNKLKETGYFPTNNYATFCAIQGKFAEAKQFYEMAKLQESGDKRLKESFYYMSILHQYSNDNKISIDELKSIIKANGSTPGFGWYNLALARNYIYDGQLKLAKKHVNRAEQFKEIHIGTTLGQSHYDFSVLLLKLILKKREIALIPFQHKYWWLSGKQLMQMGKLTLEKIGLQFLIINQFALNPERDRVIYKLFSTESTVSFDEISELVEGFSTQFFINRFRKEISEDKRFEVKRYYKFFVAKMLMKQKKYDQAQSYLESIANEIMLDRANEKLLLARTYEALALCHSKQDQPQTSQDYLQEVYSIYPQLIPFSGQRLQMHLVSNASNKKDKKITEALKKSSIILVEKIEKGTPVIRLNFKSKDKLNTITYSVEQNGKTVISPSEMSIKKHEDIGNVLSLAIFNIGHEASE